MRSRLLLAFGVLAAACGEDMATDQPDAGGGQVTASFSSLYGDYFGECKQCHAPGAPGRTTDIEKTLDFSSRGMAYTTVKLMASGLTGNQMGCNGTPFVGATAGQSLILAVLDQPTRNAFDLTAHPDCDMDAISDETVKVGSAPSAAFIAALKQWLNEGAQNN